MFHQIANQVIDTNRSFVVSVGERKVVIAPYRDEDKEDTEFFALLTDLHKKNAHLDPEAIDERVFNATVEVRHGNVAP